MLPKGTGPQFLNLPNIEKLEKKIFLSEKNLGKTKFWEKKFLKKNSTSSDNT